MTQTPVSIDGVAFEPMSSQRRPARLDTKDHLGETWVRVVADPDQELARAALSEVTIDPPVGRAARKITFADGTVFETHDHDGFATLDDNVAGAVLHGLERFSPRLLAFVLACIAGVYLLWRYGLDILVAGAIAVTPPALVAEMDRGALATLDRFMTDPTGLPKAEQDRVNAIYTDIIAALPDDQRGAHNFNLLFRDMPNVGPNAFALPGGTMVMTDAMVEEFGQTDVLAGVLGHEVGHVVGEHSLKRLYRSLGTYVLIALMAGDTGPILDEALLEGNLLLSLSFGRGQEHEADVFGLNLAHAAGYDAGGLRSFFVGLNQDPDMATPSEWLSTHPSNENRIDAIDAFLETLDR